MAISEKVEEAFKTTDVYELILQALEYAGLLHEPEGGELPECIVEGILKLDEFNREEAQMRLTVTRHSQGEIALLKERHAVDVRILAEDRNKEIDLRIAAQRLAQERYDALVVAVEQTNRYQRRIDELLRERKKNKRKK